MKKLMVIAALAMTAIAANASTFQWGLTTGTLDTTKVDKGTAYLCYYTGATTGWATALAALTSYDVSTITSTMGMQLVQVADAGGATAKGGNATFAYDGVSETKTINASTYISPASYADGTVAAGSFYYVVIDDGAKNIAYTTTAQTATINTGTGATSKKVLNSKFSYASAKSSPDPTPEPTSALLLLLGMAGLALRRKQS